MSASTMSIYDGWNPLAGAGCIGCCSIGQCTSASMKPVTMIATATRLRHRRSSAWKCGTGRVTLPEIGISIRPLDGGVIQRQGKFGMKKNIGHEHTCPYCLSVHDATSAIGSSAEPSPGDISLCITCCEYSFFDDDLSLRKPTSEEEVKLRNSPSAQRMKMQASRLIKKHRSLQ